MAYESYVLVCGGTACCSGGGDKIVEAFARELNLGVDSFVFVDDNPGNRAEMRASLPEVAVAPFPPDLSLYFHSAALTDEDRMRTAHYKAESLRREEASRLSLDDYLRSLDIKNEIHLVREEEFARVAQLAQKTNQFNVCTNRWTEDDVRSFASDSRHLIFTLHSSDRFGDLGFRRVLCYLESVLLGSRHVHGLLGDDRLQNNILSEFHALYTSWILFTAS